MDNWVIVVGVLFVVFATGAAVFFWQEKKTAVMAKENAEAEVEKRQAEVEKSQAEVEKQQAEVEKWQAETEKWRGENEKAQSAMTEARTRAESIEQHVEGLRKDNEQLREQNKEHAGEISKLETKLENTNKNAEEKITFLQNVEKKMLAEFKNLSEDVLEKKSQKFNEVLTPVRKELKDFRERAENIHTEETRELGILKNEIGNLQQNAVQVGQEANNLTRALKGDKKIQGNWGEATLLNILTASRLTENVDFKMQETYKNEGSRSIPDCVIRLPNNKHLVIDSKVSLVDFTQSVEAEHGSAEETKYLENHCKAVRNHVSNLSTKGYQSLEGVNSPDFVLMFMPAEPAYIAAVAKDKDLLMHAWNKKIIICAPSTLMPIMSTVRSMLRLEQQNNNAKNIAEQGKKIYEKLSTFLVSMKKVGDTLDQAKTSYDKANDQLKSGRGNLVRQVEKLETFGVLPTKEIHSDYADVSVDNIENEGDSEDA